MKKSILLSICILSFGQLFSQNEKSIEWGLSMQVSTGLIDDSNIETPFLLGYGMRLDVSTFLWKKIEFNTGVSIQSSALAERDYSLTFSCDFEPGSLEVNGKNSFIESKYRFHFVNIPLELKYNFTEKENHLYSKLGMHSLIKFFDKKTATLVECGKASTVTPMTPLKDLRSTVLSFSAGVGYQFKISNNRIGFCEPTISYGLTGIFQNTDNESAFQNNRMHSLGLRFGIWF